MADPRQACWNTRREFDPVHRWRVRQANHRLFDPATFRDRARCGSDDVTVPLDGTAFVDIDQHNLVALWHPFDQLQATRKCRARRQAEVIDDDRDIVIGADADIAGCFWGASGADMELSSVFRAFGPRSGWGRDAVMSSSFTTAGNRSDPANLPSHANCVLLVR
jgi:hypothetical protein